MSCRPTLLFAVESPFSERDWTRFGINELSNRFRVVIADFSPISRPILALSRKQDQKLHKSILQVSNVDVIGALFRSENPAVLLSNVGVGAVRHHLFDLANKNQTLTAEFQLGAIPSEPVPSSFTRAGVQRMRQLPSLAHLPQALRQRRINRRFGNCLPDVFFRGGLKARGRHPLHGVSIIDVHSLDYETSVDFAASKPDSSDCRVAYLDQDLGYHSDLPGLRLRHPITPEIFYPQINAYFDWLEQEKGCGVVVCPHPRTTTSHSERRFPHKKISIEKTGFEINRCSSVIGHVSTSFSFAVITRKPVVILTSREMARSWYAPYTETFARELLAPLVNLDDPATWVSPESTLTKDQQEAYELYELNYLKSYAGPTRKLWAIIGDKLLQKISG